MNIFKHLTWERLVDLCSQAGKFFIAFYLYLNLARLGTIIALHDYWTPATIPDFGYALWYGARISLKTAGAFTLLYFLTAVLIGWMIPRFLKTIRLIMLILVLNLTNIVVIASIFYYQEFHTNFNENVFNAVNDDLYALFKTFVEQYHLIPFLIIIAILSIILSYGFNKAITKEWLQSTCKFSMLQNLHPYLRRICAVLIIIALAICIRFGGSFNYAHSIHWENAAKTSDTFLNEMILDAWQALYRGYSIKGRIANGEILGVQPQKIATYLKYMAQNNDSLSLPDYNPNNLESNLRYRALGAKIARPQHIFIIIGESLPQWPLLPEYAHINLTPKLLALQKAPNSAYNRHFMPNGVFTPMAVNAVVSGLSDVDIYPNHQLESYKSIYATGIAPQLKALGYRTEFWYSGFSGWERIEDFTKAQGFDKFSSASNFSYQSGNVWGADDEYTFAHLYDEVKSNEHTPTVYVILTVSNHAPYSVDLTKAQFPREQIIAQLPPAERNNNELINKLGHIWYTDKVVGEFISKVEQNIPGNSLFIITGDHANRVNIEAQPTSYHRYAIPFIIHGQGITQNLIPHDVAGGQIDITATLEELIAPAGHIYYSLGRSLTRGSEVGFNDLYYLTNSNQGFIKQLSNGPIEENIFAKRTISWFRTMKGTTVIK